MAQIFLQALLIGYSGAIMPGSLLTYTLDKSIRSGLKAGLMISLGHALLELILVISIFLGLGKYLEAPRAQLVIGILGGIILVYLGLGMIRDIYKDKVSIDFEDNSTKGHGNLVIGGALISASNPYFILWWAVVGVGLIMNAYSAFGILGIILFYFGHILSDITWYGLVSGIIGKTRKFINLKVYKIIIGVLGIALIGFGVNFVVSSARIVYLSHL